MIDFSIFRQNLKSTPNRFVSKSRINKNVQNEFISTSEADKTQSCQSFWVTIDSSCLLTPFEIHKIDEPEAFNSIVDGKEPSFEGGKCLLESITTVHVNEDPVSQGEVFLAELDTGSAIDCNPSSEDRITTKQSLFLLLSMMETLLLLSMMETQSLYQPLIIIRLRHALVLFF